MFFLPYKDINPTDRRAYVTGGLIVLNIAAFLLSVSAPGGLHRSVFEWGVIPWEVVHFANHPSSPGPHPVLTIFSSMFLHGGVMHIGGNMLYLWIFGNNIEDHMGHLRFLLFYVLTGVVAAVSQIITHPGSLVPTVGASGAVAGVMGAYLVLYPGARVRALVWMFLWIYTIEVPAAIVLGFWILTQFLSSLMEPLTPGDGGVAWFAHIGGFLSGLVLIKSFGPSPPGGGGRTEHMPGRSVYVRRPRA